jgi:uncharacterized protein YkwD
VNGPLPGTPRTADKKLDSEYPAGYWCSWCSQWFNEFFRDLYCERIELMSDAKSSMRAAPACGMVSQRALPWLAILMVAVAMAAPVLAAQDQTDAPPTITPEQQRRARNLLGELRRADPLDEATGKIIAELMEIGEYGPTQLAAMLVRDIRTRETRYLRDFERQAGRALRADWPRDVERRIQEARAIIIDVSRRENLTKEMVQKQSDPAMEVLEGYMTITRDGVLESDEELATSRKQLLQQIAYWPDAATRIPEARRRHSADVENAEGYDETLIERETFMAVMATPMPNRDRQTFINNYATGTNLDSEEAQGVTLLNLIRVRSGLSALAIDVRLCNASRGHSKDMEEHGFFAHESPIEGKRTPGDRARLAGTRYSGENIFMGRTQAQAAIGAWWHSPGHHRNMMNPNHSVVGHGRHNRHWTQMFGP